MLVRRRLPVAKAHPAVLRCPVGISARVGEAAREVGAAECERRDRRLVGRRRWWWRRRRRRRRGWRRRDRHRLGSRRTRRTLVVRDRQRNRVATAGGVAV